MAHHFASDERLEGEAADSARQVLPEIPEVPAMDAPAIEAEAAPASVVDLPVIQAPADVESVDEEPPARVIPEGTKPTVSLRDVTVIYPAQPNKPALQDVSVDVYPGEFVFLVGHSGSGKSTFLKLCLAEEKVSQGRVHVLGKDLTKMSSRRAPKLRRQMGAVFQDFRLLDDKNVFDNVALAMQVIGRPRHHIKTAVPEVLEMVGLEGKQKRRMNELSGGELQRVAIARAMVNRPKLLLADEPTGNLDRVTAAGIMSLLDRINRRGTTVVMATHAYDIVNEMSKRVITLTDGVVVDDQEHGTYQQREQR